MPPLISLNPLSLQPDVDLLPPSLLFFCVHCAFLRRNPILFWRLWSPCAPTPLLHCSLCGNGFSRHWKCSYCICCHGANTADWWARWSSHFTSSPIFNATTAPFPQRKWNLGDQLPLLCSFRYPSHDRDCLFYEKTYCLDSSERAILARLIYRPQFFFTLSACSVILNVGGAACSAIFHTSFASITFRSRCCSYQHELSTYY